MKLAVSQIAWSADEEAAAFELLASLDVSCLELAPPRLWPKPAEAGIDDAHQARASLVAANFIPVAFQAILFGRGELTLFDSSAAREACAAYLIHIARLAGAMGIGPIVFGAPKNRLVPQTMTHKQADEIAISFFRNIGDEADRCGTFFCLEPNPADYGGNYLTHAAEAARLVRESGSNGIKLQIDAGELALNHEDIDSVIRESSDIIGHVHASQPMLGSFDDPWKGHHRLAAALHEAGYKEVVSIEMKRPPDGLAGVRRAIEFTRQCYDIG